MNDTIKKLLQSTFAVAITLGAVGAQARQSHWMDRNDDRIRNGEIVNLGEVMIGNSDHHFDADTLDLFNNPRIQCRLTHIKLSAFSDSVMITRIQVEYRDADQYGKYSDSIELNDGPGYGNGHGNGMYLDSGKSTGWLDVDDVVDGHADGRCIKSIRVYGIDTPDYNDGHGGYYGPGHGHGHGGPGYGNGHGHGGNGDNFRPARVRVDGLVGRGHHHEEPPHHEPPYHQPSHGSYKYSFLGTTGLLPKLVPQFRTINVGRNQGRFDGIKLIAKDDAFEVKSVEIIFSNGQRIRQENLQLMEGQEIYIDFDNYSHGHSDGDRFVDQVVVFGDASNPFGSKAQLEVWGGR
ncbi:MAG: hypothetical protein ACJ763_04990 [Bdellovibrionia bacterium]